MLVMPGYKIIRATHNIGGFSCFDKRLKGKTSNPATA
jgi:hypothetical protein